MAATLLSILRSGGRYDRRWAERLFAGARRRAPAIDRFLLLTDLDIAIEGAQTVPLAHDWPRWWAKMEAFRPDLASPGETVILCDLDTIFAAPADRLAAPGLAALEDAMHGGRLSSALMRFEAPDLSFVYRAFAADPERWMQPGSCGPVPNAVHGDQVVIDHLMRREGMVPSFFQASAPGLVDFYDPEVPKPAAEAGPVLVFIGDAKPDNAAADIQALWRGEV